MSTATDSAVSQVLAHVNDVEARRRLVMIRVKEAETRLGHTEEDVSAARRLLDAAHQREAASRTRLVSVLDDHRSLAADYVRGNDTLRKAETEEPFLAKHAAAALEGAAADLKRWEAEAELLQQSGAAWVGNSLTAPILAAIAVCEDQLREAAATEQGLVHAIAAAVSEAHAAASAPSPHASPTRFSSHSPATGRPSTGGGDLALQRSRLATLTTQLEESTAAAGRNEAVLEREVTDLTARRDEMQRWIDEANTATARAEALRAQLDAALASHVCVRCSGGDEGH